MVGEVEPAVFVVVVDLLLLVVLDLGVGVFISFWGYVLQGQTLFQPLAHLNYFIIISIPTHKRMLYTQQEALSLIGYESLELIIWVLALCGFVAFACRATG